MIVAGRRRMTAAAPRLLAGPVVDCWNVCARVVVVVLCEVSELGRWGGWIRRSTPQRPVVAGFTQQASKQDGDSQWLLVG